MSEVTRLTSEARGGIQALRTELVKYIAAIRRNFEEVELLRGWIALNRYEQWDKRFEGGWFDVIRYWKPNGERFPVDDDRVMYSIVNLPRERFDDRLVNAFYLIQNANTVIPHYVAAYRNELPGAISRYNNGPLENTELDPSVILHPVHGTDWKPRTAYVVELG